MYLGGQRLKCPIFFKSSRKNGIFYAETVSDKIYFGFRRDNKKNYSKYMTFSLNVYIISFFSAILQIFEHFSSYLYRQKNFKSYSFFFEIVDKKIIFN